MRLRTRIAAIWFQAWSSRADLIAAKWQRRSRRWHRRSEKFFHKLYGGK